MQLLIPIGVILVSLLLAPPHPAKASGCFQSTIASCCKSACATRNGPHWRDANKVLASCLAASGCDTSNPSVSLKCDCAK